MTPPPPLPLSPELADALETAQAIAQAERAPVVRFDHFLLAALFHTFPPTVDRILKVAATVKFYPQAEETQ